jgi:Na+/melibiose symporter-like transporter
MYMLQSMLYDSKVVLLLFKVFLPLYIIDTISIHRVFVAVAPLCLYVSGLIASFPMRAINKRLGRKTTMIIGLLFVLTSTCLFWFLVDFKGNHRTELVLVCACILLGIGTSTTSICSFSLTSDLIGLNTECGAFVYGIMSFSDKLANGLAIATIQQFNPCVLGSSTNMCASYYRHILTFIPSGVSILTILMMISIWRTNIGTNRLETIPVNVEQNSTLNQDNVVHCEHDERQPLIA